MNKTFPTLILALSLFNLTACGGESSSDDEETGTLSLHITDAPIDQAVEVVVKFSAIEIKPKSGESFSVTFETAKSLDLLTLQNGTQATLLDDQALPAGEYNWLRLMVDATETEMDSYIKFDDGSLYSLYIPSGSETGLKLNRGFTVAAGGSTDFTIDFDLRKSILPPGGNSQDYKLKPVLRMVDNSEVGHVAGSISAALASDVSCEQGLAVYAYSGSDIVADDEGSATPPLSTSIPDYQAETDSFSYQISYLPAGDYTLAITCDAENDLAESDESSADWQSLMSQNAAVSAGETTSLDFN